MSKISLKEDIWRIPYGNDSKLRYLNIYFENIKPESLKEQLKLLIWNILDDELLTTSTVDVYYNCVKNHFMPFLEEFGLEIDYLSDVTREIVDVFALYLKQKTNIAKKSKLKIMASLKGLIDIGLELELPNYPRETIFTDSYSKIFGVEDNLTTKYFEDEDLQKIKKCIADEKNMYLKSAVTIAIDTGLRISEILTIQKGCISEDFAGYPILFTDSLKSKDEICVPATEDVVNDIEELEQHYVPNEKEYLFYKRNRFGFGLYKQDDARDQLTRFLLNNDINEGNGSFHSFRHTMGTNMINNGATIHQVRTQLGHKSYHSTNLYAKMKDSTIDKEYYNMGVLGFEDSIETSEIQQPRTCRGSLADGDCLDMCENFNRCLTCNMFVTFKDDLPIHKAHLERIHKDQLLYMHEEGFNSIEKLQEVEQALVVIVERLEKRDG